MRQLVAQSHAGVVIEIVVEQDSNQWLDVGSRPVLDVKQLAHRGVAKVRQASRGLPFQGWLIDDSIIHISSAGATSPYPNGYLRCQGPYLGQVIEQLTQDAVP